MIEIKVKSGATQQMLGRWIRMGRGPRQLVMAATHGVRGVLLSHFKAKEAEPDKRGWGKSSYWMDVYRSTQITSVTDKAGTVTIGDARYSPRFSGKTIRAGKSISSKSGKPTMFLAIPAASESAHIRPLQFEQTTGIKLFFVPLDANTGLLQGYTSEKIPGRKKKGEPKTREGTRIFYVCKRSIFQPADPSWFPKKSALEDGASAEVQQFIKDELR